MPLIVTALANNLFDIFSHPDPDISNIATNVSQAYFNYASQALGPTGEPLVFKGTESALLRQELYLTMKGLLPATKAAPGLAAGVTAFWLFPPVFSVLGGVATSISPISTVSMIAKIVNTHAKTHMQAANAMADALHTMTSMVLMIENPPLVSGFII